MNRWQTLTFMEGGPAAVDLESVIWIQQVMTIVGPHGSTLEQERELTIIWCVSGVAFSVTEPFETVLAILKEYRA